MTIPTTPTSKVINLQDGILNQVRKDNVSVIVHLVNGFQLRGFVKGFDNFTVILQSEGRQSLIYKHAISTVTPLLAGANPPGARAENDQQP
ncbi:MAG: RNA chaperone Hfq [Negativicutes bacterium]|nr:RNA chaperone Hfq [Negativicutes bacterium]MDR3590274.1 RNA chaperone Hfq [Negativicutes bacterium]